MICFEVKNTEAKPTKEQSTDKEENVEQPPKEDVKKTEKKPQDDGEKKEEGSFGLNESTEEEKQPTTIEKDNDIGELKQKIIKAVARSLYVQNIDEVKLYDVDFNNGKTFYIKANLRK